MLPRRVIRLGALLAGGLLLSVRPVCAQSSQGTRPYQGLFGSDTRGADALHLVDLSIGVNAAAERASFGDMGPEVEAPADDHQFEEYYLALGQLSYARRGRPVHFSARGGVAYPYYSLFPNSNTLAYDAASDVSVSSRTTTAGAAASYRYSPYYSLDFGGFQTDYSSAYSPNNEVGATASLKHAFGRRTTANMSYSAGTTVFLDEDRETRHQGAAASIERRLSKTTVIRAGYAYERFSATEPETLGSSLSQSHGVDVGIGYTRRLSSVRQFTLEGSVGLNKLEPAVDDEVNWRGSLRATYAMSRNWGASAGYLRTFESASGLFQPVWADYANAQVVGYVGRRLTLSFGAFYTRGNDVNFPESKFTDQGGQVRAQLGVSPNLAVYAQYMYYWYDFPPTFDLPEGMSPTLRRHRIQLGISTWFPLVRAGRAPGAGSQ